MYAGVRVVPEAQRAGVGRQIGDTKMKKNEIKVGGTYIAKVAGKLTTVRVDRIIDQTAFGKACTTYAVTNLTTRRDTTFRSAAKFRNEVRPCPTCKLDVVYGCKCSKEERERQLTDHLGITSQTANDSYTIDEDGNEVSEDEKRYVVKFKRPDGTEAWLGDSGCGSVDSPLDSPHCTLSEATHCAADRNRVHGSIGYKYWIEPAPTQEDEKRADPTLVASVAVQDQTKVASANEPPTTTAVQGLTTCVTKPRTTQPSDSEPGKLVNAKSVEPIAQSHESDNFVPVNNGPLQKLGNDHGTDHIPARTGLGSYLRKETTTTVQREPPKHPLTEEQQAIIDNAPNEQVLVIEAGAGCGKTSSLVELAKSLRGRGQYTAFNTSLVAESKQKFPQSCPCNTIHSLAYRSEGYKYQHRMNKDRVRSFEIAAMLSIQPLAVTGFDGTEKKLLPSMLFGHVSRAVKNFCQSADREITLNHFSSVTGLTPNSEAFVKSMLLPKAVEMWNDISNVNGKLPFIHDHYVKVWQLNQPIISADYVLLDEAQDTSPVMLDVLDQQTKRGTRVILVGDSCQQIYSWRGAVNALAAFPDAKRLMLSQSFRFGQVIAEVANAVLNHLEQKTPLVMKGFDKIQSRLGVLDNPHAVLCRTNAAAVQTLLGAIAKDKKAHLIGGGSEVLAFVNAARDLQTGRRTEHPELSCFDNWREVQAFVKTDEGEELKLMVKLIDTFGATKIADALKRMPDEKDAELVISTAHKSKGREWDTIRLASDFMPLNKMGDEELRLLYVAATRAKQVLDVETCPPFCGGDKKASDGWNGEGGKEKVIDLTEARRLSDDVPQEQTMTTIVEEKKPIQQLPIENQWSKGKRGDWLVRGKPGQSGEVKVSRKNGTSSTEKIVKTVWQNDEVALYAVEAK